MKALNREFMYTTDYIEALPGGERAELIDGRIYYTASWTRTHQQLSGYLYRKIADYIDDQKGSCEVKRRCSCRNLCRFQHSGTENNRIGGGSHGLHYSL